MKVILLEDVKISWKKKDEVVEVNKRICKKCIIPQRI